MDLEEQNQPSDSRRSFLKKAGVVGGVAWVAPQVVNASPAFAAISDPDCVTVDTFDNFQFVADPPSPGTASNEAMHASGVLGDYRYMEVTATGGNAFAQFSAGGGLLSFSAAEAQSAVARVVYDGGPGSPGLGGGSGVAIPSGAVLLNVATKDQAAPTKVQLTIQDASLNAVTAERTLVAAGAQALGFTMAEFAGVDLNHVTSVAVAIDSSGTNSVDLWLRDFLICP